MAAAPHQTTLAERKSRLRRSFLDQLPERVAEGHGLLARLAGGEAGEPLEQLQRLFHTLKGTGASFGLNAVAARAGEADAALKEAVARGQADAGSLVAMLRRTLAELEALAQSDAAAPDDTSAPPSAPPAPRAGDRAQGGEPDGRLSRQDRLVYLFDDDQALADQLVQQLDCFGYRVRPFSRTEDLSQAVTAQPPAALLMNVIFPDGTAAGTDTVARIAQRVARPLPCVFLSSRDDFATRLKAVQAGGSAFCPKPVKTTELVELLDGLTHPEEVMPLHVMVIDDDPELAEWHALVLEDAGIRTRVVTDPTRVVEELADFNADLVLLDIYMPQCSGPDLARVLRQIPGYLGLPIVYVSSETDTGRRRQALEVGADGFLTKPIERERLVAEVGLRGERMRTLHALMVRDGLTGLFNHSALTQFLEVKLADARRDGKPLSFAMIDVDHFKQVNDQHGHAVGDQVLVALSRTLRLRLRGSDLVGRYGGEEFAVILPGAEAAEAARLLETLRRGFSQVLFASAKQGFHCTFSTGIAAYPAFDGLEALAEAADMALYRAKRDGRNRIEVAAAPPGSDP